MTAECPSMECQSIDRTIITNPAVGPPPHSPRGVRGARRSGQALELYWPWSPFLGNVVRAPHPPRPGPSGSRGPSLPPRPRGAVGRYAPRPALAGTVWRASTVPEGTVQGERYCNARGEILRPLQDRPQRRRSASACSSIKDESLGSKDDQTPS